MTTQRNLLKSNAGLFEHALRVLDPLWLVAAALLSHLIYFGDVVLPDSYVLAVTGGAIACLALFPPCGLYAPQRGVSAVTELGALFYAWVLLTLGGALFLFATKSGATYSRVWISLWLGAGFAGHALLRAALRAALRALRRRGYNLRHIVVVGAGTLGVEVALRLRNAPWSGLAIHGYYDDDTKLVGARIGNAPVRGSFDQLVHDLHQGGIDQVWIALPLKDEERIRSLLLALQDHPVQICFVPDIYGFNLLRHSFSEIGGLAVINLTDTPLSGWRGVAKTLEDYCLSLLVLLLASPLLLAIAIGVKLSSRGPVFYRQERVTWNGTRFHMLKFRSMPVDAESTTGPVWAQADERRATRFGAFLRRTSLDELPQFINVLRGEMSIVGPRPERPEFVREFRKQIPGYMQKHLVKAGITGWAQVNDLRGNTDLAKRIQYDLYYIENWSFWFDLRIMALTVINIRSTRNAY
jgi:putative colanic acid biosynthesis UDP-glucose lipid carrier transferase